MANESGDKKGGSTPWASPQAVVDDLIPLVYDELRSLASRHLRNERAEHTLDTAGLVNEAYLKLRDQDAHRFENKRHFVAVAAIAMRRILVDYARRRTGQKRGGTRRRIALDETLLTVEESAEQILAVHQALGWLAELDPRLARIVELRFFAGLTVAEAADVLEVSVRTVKREWPKAKALLAERLAALEESDD